MIIILINQLIKRNFSISTINFLIFTYLYLNVLLANKNTKINLLKFNTNTAYILTPLSRGFF